MTGRSIVIQDGRDDSHTLAHVTEEEALLTAPAPSGSDAFGRIRVSEPVTQFDSKQLFNNQPLLWDDQEISGADTTSVHSVDTASSVLGVAVTTAGVRARQTFMRFNYQPGKSQQIEMTGTHQVTGGGSGITTQWGYFDTNNGIFFQCKDGIASFVIRSSTSGSPVEDEQIQTDWNIDKFDGKGPSGITLDLTKTQVLMIDFAWLGSGPTRIGFLIGTTIHYGHEFFHSNLLEGVYMASPNLPLCYRIENDGTGAASTMRHICSTVISEGGENALGTVHYTSTEGTQVVAAAAGTVYAIIGLKLKAANLNCVMRLGDISIIATSNDDFEWILIHNPDVAGTFIYGDEDDSCLQSAKGVTANVVTNGFKIGGGFFRAEGSAPAAADAAIRLGATIAGVPDTVVLCVRPLSNNANMQGGLTWRELN